MNSKDKEKPSKYRENITSRYYESHAGHLFVNNVNPFNTAGGQAGDDKLISINKKKNKEYDHKETRQTKRPSTTPSREIVNQILKNYPFNGNFSVDDKYDEIHDPFLSGHQRTASQPMVSMSANVCGTEYTCCSRDVGKVTHHEHKVKFSEYAQQDNKQRAISNETMAGPQTDENKRCEKTTYCRPLLNMYNQQFIYKTMQRNARLQTLVKKLVIAREREKRREAWNNYINDLKNKHRYYSNEPCTISPQYVPGDYNTPATIDDFYDVRSNWRQSNPCQHLLDDLYGGYPPPYLFGRYPYDYDTSVPDVRSSRYDNTHLCFPTSSQACMLRWNRERLSNAYSYEFATRPTGRQYRGNTIVVEKDKRMLFDKLQGTRRPYSIHPWRPRSLKPIRTSVETTPAQPEAENLPQVKEEQEIITTEVRTEISPDEADIYFPYNKDAAPKENYPNEPQPPFQQSEPEKQGLSKKTLSKLRSVKPLKFDKDDVSKKIDNFKSKVVDKINKQKAALNEIRKSDSYREKYKKVSDNISKLKDRIRQSEEEAKLRTLAQIESKIDGIMRSINSIMMDIKAKKKNILSSRKSAAVSCCTTMVPSSPNDLNRHRSDPYGFIKNEDHLYEVVDSSSRSLAITEVRTRDQTTHRVSSTSKMDKILLEEMKKSDKVKRDIEELLNIRNERINCTAQITFDIPTRERSTEVTDSLSKARLKSASTTIIEEIPLNGGSMDQGHRQMTIAVNTEPLGLLALLRVSKETVKQLLSYVPHLNYITYRSLPMPTPQCVSHYICNICGAAFDRPSQLSDHIDQHNLGRTRDCCVCRHSLDMHHGRPGLFRCQCCGQRFTRAYCCELHQQTCCRQRGKPRDITSSHLLLR
uniref:C2H2-type domain-containing protein n=1 Tax=Heliothis virescens TaxID=7102 RepID=A0A2A4JYY6_HELVI